MEFPVGSVAPWDPAQREEAAGLTCSRCGEHNSDSARFCQQCGASLVEDGTASVEAVRTPQAERVATAVAFEVARVTSWGSLAPSSSQWDARAALDTARSVLEQHGGTVEDRPESPNTVVAVFGPERQGGEGTLRAVRAAAEIREAVPALEDKLDPGEGMTVAVRAGVGTCEVEDGDPDSRSEGRAVDLAVRLQRMAAPGEVIVAEDVHRLVGDAAAVEPVDRRARLDGDQPAGPLRLLSVTPERSARPEPGEAPLVGRDPERAVLREAFERTVSGAPGRFVAVVGDAGVGKTRLVEDLLRSLEGEGAATVLRTRCLPAREGGAAWPLADMVERALGLDDRGSPDEALRGIEGLFEGEEDAALAVGWVARAIGLPDGSPTREETPSALRRLLGALARRAPLVLSVDDADRADPGFWRLLREAAARAPDVPILVLCTALGLPPGAPEWEGSDTVTVVPLKALPEEELASLVEHLLGGEVDPEVRAVVVAASGGNPFAAEQFVARLVEQDLLRWDQGRWTPATDLSTRPVPENVEALIEARLQDLAVEEQAVVGLAAVVGETFPWAPMAGLLPESARPAVRDHLEALVHRQLIRPEPSDPSGETFGFRHPSIREAAARSVPDEARAEVHERYARWLEQAAGDRGPRYAEVVGSHLGSAFGLRMALGWDDPETREIGRRAAGLLEAAAVRAAGVGDARGAFLLFDRASSLLPSDDPQRPELLLQSALALVDLGEPRADAVLAEAATAARATGEKQVEWCAKVLSASLAARAAPDLDALERARATADKAMQAFRELGHDRGLAWAWSLRIFAHRRWGNSAAAARAAERSAEHARRAGLPRDEEAALRDLASAVVQGPFPVADAVQRCEGIIERLRNRRPAEQDVAGTLALLMARQGRFEEALELTAEAIAALEEMDLDEESATCVHLSGQIQALAGDLEEAERTMRRALELSNRVGREGTRARILASLAGVVGERGRTEETVELTQKAEAAAAAGDMAAQVGWRTARAKALARLGQLDAADALGREAVRLAEQTDSPELRAGALMDLAQVLHLAGRTNEAIPFARRSLRTFERRGATASASKARELLELLAARPDRRRPAGDGQASDSPHPA